MKFQAVFLTIIALLQGSIYALLNPEGIYKVGDLPNPFVGLRPRIRNKLPWITDVQDYWFTDAAREWEEWMLESSAEFAQEGLAFGSEITTWLAALRPHFSALLQTSGADVGYAEYVATASVDVIIEYLPLLILARKLREVDALGKQMLKSHARRLRQTRSQRRVCVKGQTYTSRLTSTCHYMGTCSITLRDSDGC